MALIVKLRKSLLGLVSLDHQLDDLAVSLVGINLQCTNLLVELDPNIHDPSGQLINPLSNEITQLTNNRKKKSLMRDTKKFYLRQKVYKLFGHPANGLGPSSANTRPGKS